MFKDISQNISPINPNLIYYEVAQDFILPCELFRLDTSNYNLNQNSLITSAEISVSIIKIEEINIKPGDIIAIGSVTISIDNNKYSGMYSYTYPYKRETVFFYMPKNQSWHPFAYKMSLSSEFFEKNIPLLWLNITKEMKRDTKLNQILN